MYSYNNEYPRTIVPGVINGRTGDRVVFNHGMTTEELAAFGLKLAPAKPTLTDTQKIGWDSVAFAWTVTDFSDEELQAVEDQKWMSVRLERDMLLRGTDLTAIVQIEMTGEVSTELRTFRAALRDLPSNFTNADDVTFPDLPEGVTLIDNDNNEGV